MSEDVRMAVSGSGYSEIVCGDERVYVHRLSAVAQHGLDATREMDIHHEHHWDGEPCKWVNNPERLAPENPEQHRTWNLNNQTHEAEEAAHVAAD